jgi:lipopolysaccharide biosynthesis glycosyltransferase
MSKTLAYFVVGFQPVYINLLIIAAGSLHYFHPEIDILIIADEKMTDFCKERIPFARVVSHENSSSGIIASMNKMHLFNYDVSSYHKIIYIDCDMIIHGRIDSIIDNITTPNTLYAFADTDDFEQHNKIYWGLRNYTPDDILFFKTNNIRTFNAGMFAFLNTSEMKSHFDAINEMIRTNTLPFFFEQSFMNVYFNRRNLTNTTVINDSNYCMIRDYATAFNGKVVHFADFSLGGRKKFELMYNYVKHHIPFII